MFQSTQLFAACTAGDRMVRLLESILSAPHYLHPVAKVAAGCHSWMNWRLNSMPDQQDNQRSQTDNNLVQPAMQTFSYNSVAIPI
eukprot:Gb_11074 [translate_table: standard]